MSSSLKLNLLVDQFALNKMKTTVYNKIGINKNSSRCVAVFQNQKKIKMQNEVRK